MTVRESAFANYNILMSPLEGSFTVTLTPY